MLILSCRECLLPSSAKMIHKIICQNQRSLGKLAKVDMFQQVPSPRFVHFGKDYLACMVLCFTQFQVKIV